MIPTHAAPIWTPLHIHRRMLRRYLQRSVPRVLAHASERLGRDALSVLDVGCGRMPYRSIFSDAGLCKAYDGADVETKDGVIRIDPATQRIAAGDASYDIVVHFQTMEHVPDTARFLAECRRVLRPGGVMLCTVPFLFEYHAVPGDYYRWSAQGLAWDLAASGFETLTVDAVETDWQSALGVLELVLARRFGYVWTKPLFLMLNLAAYIPLRTSPSLSPMTYAAVALKPHAA